MGMTPGPHHRGLGQPRVALPQRDTVSFRLAHQDRQRLPIQPAVGRMGDRFRLHRRVDADPLQRTGFGHPGVERNPDARLQHLLQSRRPDAPAPARHRARLDRRLMLEEFEAAEELPIRILHPASDDLLVRQVMDMLEVVQTDHQPGRLGRSADRPIEPTKSLVKARPRHDTGQPCQRMAQIDDCLQALAEQIGLAG